MNNQLIAKIINTNDVNPEFTFENPLIDRNVAGALARSFVKILRVSQQDSNINNNVRCSVLANIRQLCRIQPENHIEIDENFTKSLSEVYINSFCNPQTNETTSSVERALDDLLMRRIKEVDLNSNCKCSMKPEVVQALLNLNENNSYLESIYKDILHLNMSDKKNFALAKNLWTSNSLSSNASTSICDYMSIVMKSEIENTLLTICHSLLTDPKIETDDLFSDNTLLDLIKKCSISSECFQICIRILNYQFIHTSYNTDIRIFVSKFVKNVKIKHSNCNVNLYPTHLSSIAVLLDIDLDALSNTFKSKYVEQTLVHLKRLQDESDLVLLLSHFPQWFPIYISAPSTSIISDNFNKLSL